MKQTNMIAKTMFALLAAVALALAGFRTAYAQEAVCTVADTSTEEVIAGVTLTWDSAFACPNAPETGEFTITVNVQNDGTSTESVVLQSAELALTTPLPGGDAPNATAEASGLPLTLAPGAGGSFEVSGTYELVQTDEGMKANLHLRVSGVGGTSNTPFRLGVNIILAEGAVDEEDGEAPDDPKDDPSEGFYCVQSEIQHPFGAILAERYEVDYATLQAWFCDGFGWGQIMLALQTGKITEDDPGELLELRRAGTGWGEIWQGLNLIGRPEHAGPPNDADSNGKPDHAAPPNDESGGGKPDHAGPPNDQNGDGKPDFAGPPAGVGRPPAGRP